MSKSTPALKKVTARFTARHPSTPGASFFRPWGIRQHLRQLIGCLARRQRPARPLGRFRRGLVYFSLGLGFGFWFIFLDVLVFALCVRILILAFGLLVAFKFNLLLFGLSFLACRGRNRGRKLDALLNNMSLSINYKSKNRLTLPLGILPVRLNTLGRLAITTSTLSARAT